MREPTYSSDRQLAGDQQTKAPSIAGKVTAIGVDLGSYVKRGQMIVRLDDVDSKLRVEQAQAQLDQANAALRQAEEKIGLRPGQNFDVNRIPEVANARVALELAEKNLRRAEKLIESGDVSRANYDEQRARRDNQDVYEAAFHRRQTLRLSRLPARSSQRPTKLAGAPEFSYACFSRHG